MMEDLTRGGGREGNKFAFKQVGKHNKCVREGRKTRDGGNKI